MVHRLEWNWLRRHAADPLTLPSRNLLTFMMGSNRFWLGMCRCISNSNTNTNSNTLRPRLVLVTTPGRKKKSKSNTAEREVLGIHSGSSFLLHLPVQSLVLFLGPREQTCKNTHSFAVLCKSFGAGESKIPWYEAIEQYRGIIFALRRKPPFRIKSGTNAKSITTVENLVPRGPIPRQFLVVHLDLSGSRIRLWCC